MGDVASPELRNHTRALLDRVAAGETIPVTVNGRPTAILAPIGRRARWMSREELLAGLAGRQSDPGAY